MARVKNSNCLNFCTQVDLSKTRKFVHLFSSNMFYFREKRTFRFHPPESMDRVITGRKLNTFARFAFQRYFVQGNLIDVCSFIDSQFSLNVSCAGIGCLEAFGHAKKQCALFRYKKMSVKKTSLFTMCHYSEFHKITYVNF